jgi:curved DNA-binding protein CbpA
MRNSNGPAPARSRYLSLYGTLGISPDASPRDIRAAYEVLESAYCPGGAYIDDAMYKAFSEIRNAAKVLCNPRMRRRYDLGYIGEDGLQTGAGRAHAVRVRTAWVTGAASFAVLAIVLSGLWTVPNEAPGGARLAGPDTRVNAAAPRAETPPKVIVDAAPAPPQLAKQEQNREAPANKPAPGPGHGVAPVEASSQTHPPRETAPQRKEALPTVSRRSREARVKRVPQNSFASETKRRRYAHRPEPGGRGSFAGQQALGFWEGDIWFPRRRAYYGW